MASTSSTSKDASLPASPSYFGSLLAKIYGAKVKLFSPGPYDSLQREAKSTFPALFMIEGAKYDIASAVSGNLHVMHSFTWGNAAAPPSYHLGLTYMDPSAQVQGQVDHSGSLMTRAQYNWVPVPVPAAAPQDETKPPAEQGPPTPPEAPEVTSTSKFQGQFPAAGSMGQKVVQLEHEHVGRDFSLTLKAVNPSVTSNAPAAPQPMGLGGVPETYSVAFMQAFSSSLALGGEYAIPRSGDEPAVTLALKYAPRPSEPIPAPPVLPSGMPSPYMPVNPKDPGQVFTTSYSPSTGLIHSTYWRRLNQRLEMATEAQLLVSGGDARGIGRREGLATVGFKLDTLFASVRGSVDTHGRVATLLEERIAQGMALHLSGEIDFGRGNGGVGKVGIGFTMEM